MAARWYTVSVLSNFEKKVAEAIREGARQNGLEDDIEDILVPTEDVVEIRRGQKVHTERRFMPGYVLVKCEMSAAVQHMIANTNRVTGFLGTKERPTPLRDSEVERIIGQVTESAERPRPQISFQIGEMVRVTDGPFESFSGQVEDVDEAHSRLKVSVSIFGRATPVELEYTQVAKAS
jgi:transcriptional antiterminator NusG